MKKENGQLLFSATDLANHLGCSHLTTLEMRVADGLLKREYRQDPTLELLIQLGEAHESAYLETLKAEGKTVAVIDEFGGASSNNATLEAMRNGVDVVAQAALISLPWRGRADFLIRVDRPSALGQWSYEVVDTKLSQTTRGSTILQLCLYTEIVSTIQGVSPRQMHVVRPGLTFGVESFRVADFLAYYRMVKSRFESFVGDGGHEDSYPEPNDHCQICNWWPRCHQTWRDDDHLTFVAGISKSQRNELAGHQIETLEAFAQSPVALPEPPKRGSLQSFGKIHRQAQVQLEGRTKHEPVYKFNETGEGKGFRRLPEPDAGDVFFDIEGNPRAIGDGLEYLLGYAVEQDGQLKYQALWGLSKSKEQEAFEQFMDDMMQKWERNPGMHIYHYAPYEPSALKRLATKHATREDELDRLLRGERFVDLYAVVRQGVRASVESYSIKQLEQFYGYQRGEELKDASQALREMERLIELDLTKSITDKHRQVVETYNQDDCLSTKALRDWLEQLRNELQETTGVDVPRPDHQPGDASELVQQQADETRDVFEKLIADFGNEPVVAEQRARWLLAHMLEYFRREDKCAWWEYFRMHELEHDELLRERKAISGLQFIEEVPGGPREQTPTHRYRFETQEVTLDGGEDLVEVMGDKVGKLAAINLMDCTVDIKKRRDAVDIHPSAIFAFERIGHGSMPESLLEFGRELLTDTPRTARYDLLSKRPPRFNRCDLPMEGEQKEVAIQLALDLDNSVLPVQGPPGSGKTYIGSHMILALASTGKRVGVTAVSHKVILNLLNGVHKASQERGAVAVAHQTSSPGDDFPEFVKRLSNRNESLDALDNGFVVGGTAWLWSHPELKDKLDYLFIDEAGQMSLAMALAAGRSAKNIVLLGDPQQLEQPQQGSHPEGAEIAALLHVLDGAETMPETKGLFLRNTWRLHPEICRFTSEQYYDGRLKSQAGLEKQELFGRSGIVGFGLRFVSVDHDNNQNRSEEEVEAIAEIVNRLADGEHRWADKDGKLKTIGLNDILIVAPYNAQVSALCSALPEGARIGTVDKFQGQEAPVVIYSMTSSSASDAPRGMEFLFSRNRMNVATSRARCLVILVGSPKLFQPECRTPRQMQLANGFCRYLELAERLFIQGQA